MTNLTSPAAEPATGNPNVMPDIIDSLKRLERIGSENSKTVEKIIEAARDLEQKIVAQYERSESASIDPTTILSRIAGASNCTNYEAAESAGLEPIVLYAMRYSIEWRQGEGRGLFYRDERVSANREAALNFAKDLAGGLLFLIENDLLWRQSEEAQALDILQKAGGELSERKLPDEF
jgi:hypothetical protein